MRVVLVAIVAGVMLAFALPAFAQDVGGQEVCDWYWEDYEFNTSGGLEYWCGDPQFTAAALDEPAVSEERPVANEEPLVVEQAPQPIVVESEGVSDAPVAEEAVSEEAVAEEAVSEEAVSEEAVSEEAVSEEAVSEEAVSAAPTRDQTDEQAENAPERRLLVLGIIALTLIIAALMAWRLPMRRNVEDPAAWGNENYAPPEAPTEASPEAAKVPEGEPSSPASGAPPEEATPEPSVSSSGISNSPAREAEDAVVPVGGAAAAASARAQEERLNQERLRRIRHLRRIRQGRSPSSW